MSGYLSPSHKFQITVVIPCHNYARFLGACLHSVSRSTLGTAGKVRVIVIDDSSDDRPEEVFQEFAGGLPQAEFHRVNFRDVHQVRRFGLSLVETKYCMFLDADNQLYKTYLSSAVQRLEADRNAAFVFPVLLAFDGGIGFWHGTDLAPDVVRWQDIEGRNWCDAGCVHRTEVLKSSLALNGEVSTACTAQDWRMARNVLRSGPWHGLKSEVPLHYRVHSAQMTAQPSKTYWIDADLEHETVTIIVAFSGRWEMWENLRGWIVNQEWPAGQTRLLILNSTHSALSVADFGLEDLKLSGIQIERMDAGRPKLADEDRRPSEYVRADVEAAVSGLYNRASQLAFGEYLFFLEDDVIPHRPDAIRQLLQTMGPNVAAVSGVYQHRYQENAVAFHLPFTGQMFPMGGPDLEQVGGTGFGCLIARKSLLLKHALSGDDVIQPHYDVDFAAKMRRDGWEWWLDRTVKCDHLVKVDELPEELKVEKVESSPLELWANLPQPACDNNVTKKCDSLGPVVVTNACSCGAQIDIFHCNRQNMNAVKTQIDFERELDRRHSSPAEKVTTQELRRILAVCQRCPLYKT